MAIQKNNSEFDKILPVLFRTIWAVILLLIIFSVSYSCKNYDVSNEIRRSDTLLSWLNTSQKFMIIEENLIEKRIDSMQERISFLKTLDSLKMNDEFRFDYARYRGMVKNYQRFLDDYKLAKYNQAEYRTQLDKLKKGLIDKKINKETFISEFSELKPKIKSHLTNSRELVKKVLSYEKMYQRINNKIIDFTDKNFKKGQNFHTP